MAHYQVFIPDARPDWSELARVGLGGLAEDARPDALFVEHGPDDKPGAIFAWHVVSLTNPDAVPARFGYEPRLQEWTPLRAGAFYFGQEPARPITPTCIARVKTYPGLPAMLGDGQEWEIPKTELLPKVWGVDDDGEFSLRIAPKFREYCALSERVFCNFYEQSQDPAAGDIVLPEAFEYCCRALALNYRLTKDVISWLGLIDDGNFVNILMASIEMPLILKVEEALKKKAASCSTPAT